MGDAILDPFIYQPIEDIIIRSLMCIKDQEIRKKFASSILVIGGGAHLHKLSEEIIIKLNGKLEGKPGFEEKL